MEHAPPRLKSGLWVMAFLRTSSVLGRFGAVLNKGAEEAGSIYVVINHLDGTYDLLGPPPGPSIDDSGEHRFVRETAAATDWEAIRTRMEKKRRIDPDFWLVEVEDREGLAGLKVEES